MSDRVGFPTGESGEKASQSPGWVFIFAITTSLCLLKPGRILNTNWFLARA